MPEQHTVRSYDDELSDLAQKIAEMSLTQLKAVLDAYQPVDEVAAS